MSEARALTNFAGNSVATVLIGHWTGSLDHARLDRVLSGAEPFDETTMVDDHDAPAASDDPGSAQGDLPEDVPGPRTAERETVSSGV